MGVVDSFGTPPRSPLRGSPWQRSRREHGHEPDTLQTLAGDFGRGESPQAAVPAGRPIASPRSFGFRQLTSRSRSNVVLWRDLETGRHHIRRRLVRVCAPGLEALRYVSRMLDSTGGSREYLVFLRDLGMLCPVAGFAASFTLLVAMASRETFALWPFAITAIASFLLWAVLYLPFRQAGRTSLATATLAAAAGWGVVSALGAIPLYLISMRLGGGSAYPCSDFANAFFESLSGFTTTGLSVIPRPDLLPHTLQWWRSLTQWIGGMGVVVIVFSVFARAIQTSGNLFFAEQHESIRPSIRATARTMFRIYGLYTLCGLIALWGLGMPAWDALNHSMTALSTGGFTIYASGLAGHAGVAVQLVLLLLMFLGATNFAVHHRLLAGNGRVLWTDYQSRWQLLLVASFVLLLFLEMLLVLPVKRALLPSLFQGVAAATTTGFQTADVRTWSDTAKLILVVAMMIGGATGSTAGGIKVLRFLYLIRGSGLRLRQVFFPSETAKTMKMGAKTLTRLEASVRFEQAAVLSFLWLCSLIIGVVVLLHSLPEPVSVLDVTFEVTSAQATAGLSVGITRPNMPTAAKLVLCFNMWMGRLEIFPLLLFFSSLFGGFSHAATPSTRLGRKRRGTGSRSPRPAPRPRLPPRPARGHLPTRRAPTSETEREEGRPLEEAEPDRKG